MHWKLIEINQHTEKEKRDSDPIASSQIAGRIKEVVVELEKVKSINNWAASTSTISF
jgi:hypothetical protein